MDIRKDLLIKLKEKLFRGSPKIIRARLLAKDQPFSTNYISRCLNPEHKNFSQVIFEEAILLGEENVIHMKEFIQKIENLNHGN